MRIQHNISSLNTHRNLSMNQKATSKTLEKLSSGYRINRAGDDAAGLAISEKMRGQIRGLDMAQKNVQDAIGLVQTAEGAMTEIHAMLQRGRELSVQAANDTNTEFDREQLQKELSQINEEIDHISLRTEFNTRQILQGNGSSVAPPNSVSPPTSTTGNEKLDALIKKLQEKLLEGAEDLVTDGYGIQVTPPKSIDVQFMAKDAGGTLAWVTSYFSSTTGVSSKWELTFDTIDVLDNNMDEDELASVTAHEMTHGMMSASGMDWRSSSIPTWFKEGTAEYLTGGMTRITNDLIIQAGMSFDKAVYASETEIQDLVSAITGASDNSRFYSASYATTRYLDHWIGERAPGKSIKDLMGELQNGSTLDTALQAVTGTNLAGFDTDLKDTVKGIAFIQNFVKNDTSLGSVITTLQTPADLTNYGKALDESDNFKYVWSDKIVTASVGSPMYGQQSANVANANKGLQMQVGANEGQSIDIKLPYVTANILGIAGADVTTHQSAASYITKYDDAIRLISTERSYLGAIQNRLEHTINNLGTASENLLNAESRIRDTDMASEMMKFTKNNILTQAAQSMLSQANQQPQAILQLLG
ncbi:MAG: flagellinolysin [Caryophanon sp.]|nr:flagellinolysin [Caryophanon sp.]